ncbi:hypothetical protein VPNG_05013 [Cytospora leucostoma]|uniref:Heterokaryon incompatibility domain-containing protein n=1 Tax=Cytospora leucostoma TaxID=1230097 RepID=A0A423X736_9PEZI|nr:hypothetical protein VPNG_05013 [Cytospora leucostoma]
MGVFPLVKFHYGPKATSGWKAIDGLTVIEGSSNTTEYVTISHVWSDGYGNEKDNKLWRCQLELIRRLLEKVGGDTMPFWMDTLLLPVSTQHNDDIRRKKKALQQIHTIFDQSHRTIVLDKGLISMSIMDQNKPCMTALMILASGWMRRLWTLQEAHLGKELLIAFAEQQSLGSQDFSKLRVDIRKQADSTTSIMAGLIHKELAWSIADDANVHESSHDDEAPKDMIKIANSWRAARWRVGSRMPP